MGEMNASTLIAAQKGFNALFRESFDGARGLWVRHAMEVASIHLIENQNWLGRVPAMREWIDTKVAVGLSGFDYAVKNKDWEATIEIDRNDFEDDNLGLYTPRIRDLGMRAKQHPDSLVSLRRRDGVTGLCYDGQFFYDTDHQEGDSGAQSNKLTGTGITAALVRADLFAAKAAFFKLKDDKGEPFVQQMGPQDIVAVIPADLLAIFDELNNPAPGSTVPKTPIDYEVDPRLTDAKDWYLDFIGFPVKPFLKQNRKAVSFVALDDPNATETVFMKKKLYYGVEGRYEVAYGLWQLSMMINNT